MSSAAAPILVVTADVQAAYRLMEEIRFFLADPTIEVLSFPDWETLPYDVFSPLPELVSQRLLTLHRLRRLQRGVVVVPIATLLQRLLPQAFLDANSLLLQRGEALDLDPFRQRLEAAGYNCVSQVMAHGEFAVRGSLLDLFPMGSDTPYRIDLFDREIDSIRTFDPETQRTLDKVERIELLPAREYPIDQDAIARFRKTYREQIEGDPQRSLIYRGVSEGQPPGGIEYYLPLFFESTETLFDYLPESSVVVFDAHLQDETRHFLDGVAERYEQRRYDLERPLLPPEAIYLDAEELNARIERFGTVETAKGDAECGGSADGCINLAEQARPASRHPGQGRRAGAGAACRDDRQRCPRTVRRRNRRTARGTARNPAWLWHSSYRRKGLAGVPRQRRLALYHRRRPRKRAVADR